MQLQKVDIMFAACDRALENNISFGSLLIVFIVVDFEAELCDGDFVVIDEELVVVTFARHSRYWRSLCRQYRSSLYICLSSALWP